MKKSTVLKLLSISMLLMALVSACKKQSGELTTVNFHLYNPVTNEPYSGVRVSILQEKNTSSGFDSGRETEVIWEGTTDAEGRASHSFLCYNSTKYSYWQVVDDAFYNNPAIELLQQPEYLPLNKNAVNELSYLAVQNTINTVSWFKNYYCTGDGDKMRYRKRSMVDPYDDWSEWLPGSNNALFPEGYIEGCYESLSQIQLRRQDIWEVEFETIRNGTTMRFKDTLYMDGRHGTADTLKFFY